MKFRLPYIRMPGRAALISITIGLLVLGFLSFRLASLAPRLSPGEQAVVRSSLSLHTIANNPLFAPQKLMVWLMHFAPGKWQVLAIRLPSVMLAIIALGAFTYILHRWYGRRSTIFGFVLFVTSAAYLHVARFAGFDIMYLTAILALLAVHIAINDDEESAGRWFIWLAVNVLLLFVPGMVWFVILNLLWQWRATLRAIQNLSAWQRATSAIMLVAGLSAVAQAFVRNYALAFTWLGAPSQLTTFQRLRHTLLDTLLSIVYRSPAHPEQWLGHLPLLDIFTLFMAFVGIAFYARHWRASRTHMLMAFLIVGIVLVSLGVVSICLLVPLLYIMAVGGIAYTLFFWLRKFPRNPIARYAGIMIVAAITALACYYNLVQYFVAWPHNPEVAAVYSQK